MADSGDMASDVIESINSMNQMMVICSGKTR